jgi:hypothetical protein
MVGGSTAALLARTPPAPAPPPADHTLEQRLITLEHERTELLAELQRLKQADQEAVHQLAIALQEKDDEIRRLSETVSQLQVSRVRIAGAAKKLARPSIQLISEALVATQGPVAGCFTEWSQRNAGTRDEVSEATLVVGLMITPGGTGVMERIVSTPDHHPATENGIPGRSVLEFCVSEQVAGARFAPGAEQLEVEVAVHWSLGQIAMFPVIVGHRPVSAASAASAASGLRRPSDPL